MSFMMPAIMGAARAFGSGVVKRAGVKAAGALGRLGMTKISGALGNARRGVVAKAQEEVEKGVKKVLTQHIGAPAHAALSRLGGSVMRHIPQQLHSGARAIGHEATRHMEAMVGRGGSTSRAHTNPGRVPGGGAARSAVLDLMHPRDAIQRPPGKLRSRQQFKRMGNKPRRP